MILDETSCATHKSLHVRIMNIAKDNTMAAIILTGIDPDKKSHVLDIMEKFQFSREMVNCIWSHIVKHDRTAFDNYVSQITERPVGCGHGCIWPPISKDESEIFGSITKPSFHDCAMAECEVPSQYYCGRCYCVRYCGPLHQRLDWPRHKSECAATIESISMLMQYGEDYARRALKNHISISDECFARLWKKRVELSRIATE